MTALELIEAKRAETLKRVNRLRTQLETAEADLRNLEITADTLTRLNLNPAVDTAVPRGQSFSHVHGVVGDSEQDAKTPKEIHEALVANGVTTISQDNVRTILSRNKDTFISNEGRYWKKGEEGEARNQGSDHTPKENEPNSENAVGSDTADKGAPTPTSAWSNTQTTEIDW